MYLRALTLLLVFVFLFGCDKEPPITEAMLDGGLIFDPILNDPDQFLVSARYPDPTPADLEKHILIAAHGFSASTFEWSELREWSTDTSYRISSVLLGGHGRTYADFRASSWEDWMESITLEYEKLEALGYRRISLVGSSTSGALLLELLESNYFFGRTAPANVFLVDPIVLPSVKLQNIAGIIGPVLVYIDTEQPAEEDRYYYHFRPHETISELNELLRGVRRGLEDGFYLPEGTSLKTYHSRHDPTANSLSSVLIYRGIELYGGGKTEVRIMDSDIHVFTRLKLRDRVTDLQRANQEEVFSEIAQRLRR